MLYFRHFLQAHYTHAFIYQTNRSENKEQFCAFTSCFDMSSALTVSCIATKAMVQNQNRMVGSFGYNLNCNQSVIQYLAVDQSGMKDDPMEIDIWGGILINLSQTSSMSSDLIKNIDVSSGGENLRCFPSVHENEGSIYGMSFGEDGLKEAQQIERCVINEIEQIRREFRAPIVEVSENLTQVGKSLSLFYCSNNAKYKNNKQFQYLSYTFERMAGFSVGSYARMLAQHWLENRHVLEELAHHSLSEIGVGVWVSSERIVISIVKN